MSRPIYAFLPSRKSTSIKRKRLLEPELANKRINVDQNHKIRVPIKNQNENVHQQDTSIIKIFSALDQALVYHHAISYGEGTASFHYLQHSLETQAKKSFTLESLERIVSIWPESFKISPTIILFNGKRIGSLSIDFPTKEFNLAARLKQFRSRLELSQSITTDLKKIIPKNVSSNTIICLPEKKKQAIQELEKKTTSTSDTSIDSNKSLKYRQTSLLERIRFKHTRNTHTSPAFEQLNSLQKLSNIVECLFVLLATYPRKSAFSMSEVVTVLTSSLKHPLSITEIHKLLAVLVNTLPKFCQIIKISDTLSAIKFYRNYKLAEIKKIIELKQIELQV
ncbi:hypothetical protein PNEG_01836 [Pneumocystis murina B123]|uniref:DNA replication factor Cdt1 C-terminal domain-containing protein n=1 Tax=Pneumocystis murina (strain B123) TaxID=1069680 RepID=M7NS29_PNEMU|nr:hypothetical protein PNEG_01836 [Pneumocystis murina B123]EMR10087.1 hypothetical protein PNEG_01836 [Pneumocystis murina B123]